MDFDENKKVEVEISENAFVENRVGAKKKQKFSLKKWGLDAVDVAMIPVAIGVFLSLGFLFAGLFKATGISDVVTSAASLIDGLF